MTWKLLVTIQTSTNWLLTESVSGSLFKISHSVNGSNIQSLRCVAAQVFNQDFEETYFDFKRLAYKPESEILSFVQPQGLLNRKLAIKRLDDLPNNWAITIEVLELDEISTVDSLLQNIQANLEEVKMTLTNPITVNIPAPPPQELIQTVIKTLVPVPANLADSVVLAAANADRRGLSIWNKSVGDICIEFDGTPTLINHALIIAPGGYYESSYLFIGEVRGVWSNSGGDGALVREFVLGSTEPAA